MRLALVGSTSFKASDGLEDAEAIIRWIIQLPKWRPSELISGGAEGIDSLTELIADELDLPMKVFHPANRCWAPHGFKERNLQIADYCDQLLAVRCKDSSTYGSGWTADRAQGLGKLVWRVTL